ncbi:hypothetical protein BGZ99_002799, partial [Dissophora globulifera]
MQHSISSSVNPLISASCNDAKLGLPLQSVATGVVLMLPHNVHAADHDDIDDFEESGVEQDDPAARRG